MRYEARALLLVTSLAMPWVCNAEGRAASGKAGGKGATTQAPAQRSVLPFSHDDYASARLRAQRESKLLVVEAWATWCHTCQSMRSFVFTDPLLKPVADRFVFVALDTDRPVNAPFVEHFPINSWPTMLVLDPGQSGAALSDERVLSRWTGAMTAAELLARLTKATPNAQGESKLLEQADAAAAEGRWDAAAPLFSQVVERSVVDRPRALLGLIQSMRQRGDYPGCAELAERALGATGNGAASTDFSAYASSCLDHISDADRRQKVRQKLRAHLLQLVQDFGAPLSVDDRSDGYGTLTDLCDALGDRAQGDRLADARLRMLEAAATAARSPQEASTFDLHRLDSYRRLGRYDQAERMLLASARAMPGDFNPGARLARLYLEMGRLDDALKQVNDALSKAYGPRRANLLELQGNIRAGLGQTREAVQSLLAAIAVVEAMPSSGRSEHKLGLLRKHIASLQHILSAGGSAPSKGPRGEGPNTLPVAARSVAEAAPRRLTQGRVGPALIRETR